MAMNSMSWAENWFELEVPEMERQVSNWCNMHANENLQIVFDVKSLKDFLHKNKIHKSTDGKHCSFSTKNILFAWNEVENEWGYVYKITSHKDLEEVLYKCPSTPSNSGGYAYVAKH